MKVNQFCTDNVAVLNVAVLLVCITLHKTVCSLQTSGLITQH